VIVLDTSYLIDFFKNEDLKRLIPDHEKPAMTVISYYEIMAGIQRLKSLKEEKFYGIFSRILISWNSISLLRR